MARRDWRPLRASVPFNQCVFLGTDVEFSSTVDRIIKFDIIQQKHRINIPFCFIRVITDNCCFLRSIQI